jgi:hypothetical protein
MRPDAAVSTRFTEYGVRVRTIGSIDFDRAALGQWPIPWAEVMRKRHDLRVRNATLNPENAAANRRVLGLVGSLVPVHLTRQLMMRAPGHRYRQLWPSCYRCY